MGWKMLPPTLYQNPRIAGAGLKKTYLIFGVLKTVSPASTIVGLSELGLKLFQVESLLIPCRRSGELVIRVGCISSLSYPQPPVGYLGKGGPCPGVVINVSLA